MVTSVDVYKEIRRLQLEGITSQRAAAKRLGISRNTVKKYWEGNAVPWNRKEYSREAAVMTLDVVQFISVCLDEDDRERVKKQKHTARQIYQRLVEEKNFTGSESSVRNLVHDMRAARKETKAFVPLRFAPGEAVQIDWGEATVYLNGEKVIPNLFCSRLCHSCAPYVIAYKRRIWRVFWMPSSIPSSITAASPDGLSLTMPVLRSRVGSAPMQRRRMTTSNCLHITDLSLSSAIQPPETKRDW